MVQVTDQPVAGLGRMVDQHGALLRHLVGGTARVGAGQQDRTQQPADPTGGHVRNGLVKRLADAVEAGLGGMVDERQIGLVAAFVLPPFEGGGEEVHL